MTITTSLAKAFSFTFNPPSKTAVLPCNGNLSNQQIGSIVSNEWRFYAPANFMTLAVEQETARRGPTWRILGFVHSLNEFMNPETDARFLHSLLFLRFEFDEKAFLRSLRRTWYIAVSRSNSSEICSIFFRHASWHVHID